MTAVLLSTDLIAISQVQNAVTGGKVVVRAASSEAQALATVRDEQATLLVVDLAAPLPDLAEFAVNVRAVSPAAIRLIAFGPHVHVEKLNAARSAGFDAVFTRGQFLTQAKEVLDCGPRLPE